MGKNRQLRTLDSYNLKFRILESKISKSAKILNSGFWKAKILKSDKIFYSGFWEANILNST